MSGTTKAAVPDVTGALIADWQAARKALRAIEEAEHPDLTDAFGRTWRWMDGELYGHDKMAWTKAMVLAPGIGLPSQYALENPNYAWCAVCKGQKA